MERRLQPVKEHKMNGTEWLNKLPEQYSVERDKLVLKGIEDGVLQSTWSAVKSEFEGEEAIFSVTSDALHAVLDDGSRFRPQCTAVLQQKCADLLAASLPTAKMMDLSYAQAEVKLDCQPLAASGKMTYTSASKEYNLLLEKKRGNREGLIRDCGKSWILSNKMSKSSNTAVNHGFYSSSGPARSGLGQKLYQNEGAAHNKLHTDYSQVIILMSSECLLNNELVKVTDLMSHPKLSKLLNYSGKLYFNKV